jgi:membrane fusion protein (multidrug efflux system)
MSEPRLKDDELPPDEAAPADRDDAREAGEPPVDRKEAQQDEGERGAREQPPQQKSFLRRRAFTLMVVAILAVIALAAGLLWWEHARHFESTDDAFIDTRIVSISSQVAGMIVGVPVTDNQNVVAGATLVLIDPRDYQVAVDQAKAQVDQAKAMITNLDAQIDAQQARIDQAQKQVEQTEAALTFASQENQRNQDLLRRNAGTPQAAQQASSNLIQAQANVASAKANAEATKKQIPVLQAQRKNNEGQLEQVQATLELAQVNLLRTRILAPQAGRATKITAAVGAYAQAGQVLMLFVPDNKWVTANFKETQLALMRPGQPVDISIDAYPGRVFRGRVDSLQAGSGAAFSLLPPENATGNYVKVVQRVPVKIVFDEPPDVYIGPGMSVVPTVRVQ